MTQRPTTEDKYRKLTSMNAPLVKTMTMRAWKYFLYAVLALTVDLVVTRSTADTEHRIHRTKSISKCLVVQIYSIIHCTGLRIRRIHRYGKERPKIIDEPTLYIVHRLIIRLEL